MKYGRDMDLHEGPLCSFGFSRGTEAIKKLLIYIDVFNNIHADVFAKKIIYQTIGSTILWFFFSLNYTKLRVMCN